MYLLIFHSHLQNTQTHRQHRIVFIYTSVFLLVCFSIVYGSTYRFYTYIQTTTLSTPHYNDNVRNPVTHNNDNAFLSTKPHRPGVVLEKGHECTQFTPGSSPSVAQLSIFDSEC